MHADGGDSSANTKALQCQKPGQLICSENPQVPRRLNRQNLPCPYLRRFLFFSYGTIHVDSHRTRFYRLMFSMHNLHSCTNGGESIFN